MSGRIILLLGRSFISRPAGSTYSCGRSRHWLKVKNPAVRREAEEEWR
jgi:hypothetical protein